jgi:hypothetical protein
MYMQYKNDTRKTLGMTTTDKEALEKKRHLEFEKVRAKFNIANKGIDSFTIGELKKFYELNAITKYVYRRQVAILKELKTSKQSEKKKAHIIAELRIT